MSGCRARTYSRSGQRTSTLALGRTHGSIIRDKKEREKEKGESNIDIEKARLREKKKKRRMQEKREN